MKPETTDKLSRNIADPTGGCQRLTSKPGTKEYNALSIAIDYRSDIAAVQYPKCSSYSRVDSAVIALGMPKATPYAKPIDEKLFLP